MKKNRIIAMLLGTALLVCGCQQTSKATDEEKKIESEKNTTKTEENAMPRTPRSQICYMPVMRWWRRRRISACR